MNLFQLRLADDPGRDIGSVTMDETQDRLSHLWRAYRLQVDHSILGIEQKYCIGVVRKVCLYFCLMEDNLQFSENVEE